MASSSSPSSAATNPGAQSRSWSSRPAISRARTASTSTATSRRSCRRAPTAATSCWPKCASWWRPAWRAAGGAPDGQDPPGRGQRDEPGHAVPPPRAPWLRGGHRGRRRAGRGDGALGGAGVDPDGHEPAGARWVAGHASDQGRAGDARHSCDRAHRARDVRRPREGDRRRLRRLRHQAGRFRPPRREDRGAARAGGRRVSIDPAAQLRHELRTPLNHIIGYAELLLEELADGSKLELTAGLSALRADARQLLTLLNEVLARGQAGPPDLAAARDALGAPLERIRAEGDVLLRLVSQASAAALLPDVERIRAATERLAEILGRAAVTTPRESVATWLDSSPPAPSRPVILVVDDNDENRDMLARRLARQNYEVLRAVGGLAALETLAARPVDLVLLDVMMPDLDGYAVLQRLKADPALRSIPVLMISALDEIESVVRCIQLGAEDYLSKPFDPVLLQARVGACLEKKRLHDEMGRRRQEVAEWNEKLEQRVAEQIAQLERLGRLKRFFSPQLAELIVAGGAGDPLETHRREVTVVFLDLRGFTAFAETAEPEEVMGVLREYHAEMGRLILEHEGTLERFTGDGMMVFFNDPVEVSNPAERAIRMALAMRDVVTGLAAGWRKRGWDLALGVGIAQGFATIGAIGFEGRMDYGAIGTVTNLAARLCGEAAGGQILVSARVAAAVESLVDADDIGPITLKGFARPIPVWSVRGLR